MPPVLRALPFFEQRTEIPIGTEVVEIAAYQIIVWVAVAPADQMVPPDPARRFPAVLDTGFSGMFSVSPSQLRRWGSVEWNELPYDPRGRPRYQGVEVPHRRGNIWLYPNQYGWRDSIDPLFPPLRIEMYGGIAVYGDGEQVGSAATTRLVAPRLPLLGLRALAHNRLQLTVDAANREVWLTS